MVMKNRKDIKEQITEIEIRASQEGRELNKDELSHIKILRWVLNK